MKLSDQQLFLDRCHDGVVIRAGDIVAVLMPDATSEHDAWLALNHIRSSPIPRARYRGQDPIDL